MLQAWLEQPLAVLVQRLGQTGSELQRLCWPHRPPGLVGAITTSVVLSSDSTKKGLLSPPKSLSSTTALTKASADYQAQTVCCVVSVGQCNIRARLPAPSR